MPVAPPNNAYLAGIAKQTNEATVGSVANYSVPVFSSTIAPMYDERRVEVTDSASIEADVYKGQTAWGGDLEFPAFSRSLGRFLQSLWPTDGITGVGPYVHTFSGFGTTQPWITLYDTWTSGSLASTFGKGICTGMGFSADQDGGPLKVRFSAYGSVPSITAYTVTTVDDLTQGYFTLQSATATLKADVDTPDVAPTVSMTNVESVTIDMSRAGTPVPTVDGVIVSNIGQGKGSPSGSMSMIWNTWDEYRATFFGAVAGTAASSTIVNGALKLNFTHTLTADLFSIYVPKVQFKANRPAPSPSGDVLKLDVALNINKPATGDHVQPVLTNSVSTAYSA